MRLNRGTIALVVVGLIVIVGVLLINNRQENAPDATPTATPQTGGPLFPELTADALARVEVRDNTNGARTVLVNTSAGLWELDEPSASSSDPEALQALVATLQAPAEVTEEAAATPEATLSPETTPDPELDQNMVLTTLSGLVGLSASDRFDSDQLEGFELSQPHYSILITSIDGSVHMLHIGGENPSGNRYYVVQEQLSIDEVTPEPTPAIAQTEIATDEATEESDAVATETVDSESAGTEEPTEEATVEATEDATAEPTAEATIDLSELLGPLPTPTPMPLAQPLVTLTGSLTINTIPKTIIDQLIGYIASPPYFVPTPTPTLPFAIPEITLETSPEVTEEATVEATEEATAEPTTPPTARPTRTATAESTTSPTSEATEAATSES